MVTTFRLNTADGKSYVGEIRGGFIDIDGVGASEHDRQCAYRQLFRAQIPEIDIHDIRQCLAYNHPLGNDRFQKQVESTLGKRIGRRQRGRPPKHGDAPR